MQCKPIGVCTAVRYFLKEANRLNQPCVVTGGDMEQFSRQFIEAIAATAIGT